MVVVILSEETTQSPSSTRTCFVLTITGTGTGTRFFRFTLKTLKPHNSTLVDIELSQL